jgi:hypothetical protein
MGRPSAPHESRVDILNAVAVMAGYTAPSQIAAGLMPDVVRLDLRHRGLFVADAKETETPGTRHTRDRLRSYALAARAWLHAGYTARLAICHGDPASPGPWLSLLQVAARDAAVHGSEGGWAILDHDNVLCWVDLSPAPRTDARATRPAVSASR